MSGLIGVQRNRFNSSVLIQPKSEVIQAKIGQEAAQEIYFLRLVEEEDHTKNTQSNQEAFRIAFGILTWHR